MMFQVTSVPRSEIDAWPVATAGLPRRIVNSVQAAGTQTVGELRKWSDENLLQLRSFGRISLDQVHYFFKLCDRIEKGNQAFASIREVLDIFLDPAQYNVISQRYGLNELPRVASRNWVTLQAIGNQDGKTRERVRQIEETAMEKLGSHMAFVCMEPFYYYLETFIRNRASAVAADEMADLPREGALGGFNPCSVALLLSDLRPDRIAFHNDFFTILPMAEVCEVERQVLDQLHAAAEPLHIDALLAKVTPPQSLVGSTALQRAVTVVMDHCPEAGAAVDGRYFLYTTSVLPFLHGILQGLESPAHYRAVTSTFNTRVKARSRKGAGYILDMLNRSPRFHRVDRGLYALKK